MDGHDDVILSGYNFLKEWKDITNQKRIRDDENDKIVSAFGSIRWRFDDDEKLVVKPDYPHKVNGGKYAIKTDSYFEYKKMAWRKGLVHHDDVLFFTYKLIVEFPFILRALRAKFPYFFVDEFQDTNPIQAKILKLIGMEETIVGVIGDKAQSIYGFQGAVLSQFDDFFIPEIHEYSLIKNRRSTHKIVDLLNFIRKDLQQEKSPERDIGLMPVLYVGDKSLAFKQVRELCGDAEFCSLSRDNNTSNVMRREFDIDVPHEDLLKVLNEVDSNSTRKKAIHSCIVSLELARQGCFRDAIKKLAYFFADNSQDGKKNALRCLNFLLKNYEKFNKLKLIDFHGFLKINMINEIANLAKGGIKDFYESHTYQQLSVCVKIADDKSLHRTIHRAKGDEFDNVFLVLNDAGKDLSFLLRPSLNNNKAEGEEQRIYYVAISRAKKQLFISIPSFSGLSDADKRKLASLLNIVEIES